MKSYFFAYLLSLFLGLQLAVAGPIVARNPKLPDQVQIDKDFKAPATDKVMFFTGFPNKQLKGIQQWANSKGLVVLRDSYPDNYLDRNQYDSPTDAEYNDFLKRVSTTFAKGTKGISYLMVYGDGFPGVDRIFYSTEFPAIKTKGDVTEIRQISEKSKPNNPKKEGQYTVWWKKGDADPKPPTAAGPTTTKATAAGPTTTKATAAGPTTTKATVVTNAPTTTKATTVKATAKTTTKKTT